MQDKKAFKKPNKQSIQKKHKGFAYADIASLMYGEHTMSKKMNAMEKALQVLKGLSFDELQSVQSQVATVKQKVASKMSDAEKMKRLEGYDTKIQSLQDELSMYRKLRSRLAHELGLTEIVKASRNGSKVWNLAFKVCKKGKAKMLKATVKKEGSTKKPFEHTFTIQKVAGKDTLTKASRKEGFEKLAIHYGVDIASKAYNNISTNNWLASLVNFCSGEQINVERKTI